MTHRRMQLLLASSAKLPVVRAMPSEECAKVYDWVKQFKRNNTEILQAVCGCDMPDDQIEALNHFLQPLFMILQDVNVTALSACHR